METSRVMLIVAVMILKTCYSEEPECSKFQYEEKLLEKLIRMEIGMDEIRQEMKRMHERVNQGLSLLQSERQGFKADIDKIKQGSGATYVRWGRNTCPASAELVYRGFIGGKHHNTEGSGSNSLCLPSDPTWSNYVDGNDDGHRGLIYGTEIDVSDDVFEYSVNEQDMPCAVCRTQKPSALMIPARKDCYPGWTIEYSGYLMGANSILHGSYNYICMDHLPEFLQHGGTNDNQHILYLVEAQCGSLPCPPYVNGRELACVVCSK